MLGLLNFYWLLTDPPRKDRESLDYATIVVISSVCVLDVAAYTYMIAGWL